MPGHRLERPPTATRRSVPGHVPTPQADTNSRATQPGRGGFLALQRRLGNKGVQDLVAPRSTGSATTAGRGLPPALRARMERAFGTDLSDVRVHQGSQAGAVGAVAYTRGSDIHFGPGEYQPHTRYGQALLGHELTHVVQQRAGRVGRGTDPDAGLEREAHETGLAAARGEVVHLPGAGRTYAGDTASAGGGGAAPIQRTPKKLKRLLRYLGLMNQPGGGGGGAAAAPAATPLDDFVAAYDLARYYHGSTPENAQSIHDTGLLTQADRKRVLGTDVHGLTAQMYSEFGGDEKKGVYLGPRDFMEYEFFRQSSTPIPPDLVRIFLPADRTNVADDIYTAAPNELAPDRNYGGAFIAKSSVPAEQTHFGNMSDAVQAYRRGDEAAVDRLGSILRTVATHYPGAQPTEDAMVDLLEQAMTARRLSRRPLDVKGRPKWAGR